MNIMLLQFMQKKAIEVLNLKIQCIPFSLKIQRIIAYNLYKKMMMVYIAFPESQI